jgi:hypothetical protein
MFCRLRRFTHSWIAILAVLSGFLSHCSSRVGLQASDIRSSVDSVIIGRIRLLPGSSCTRACQLPTFELRNVTESKSTSFTTRDWMELTPGQSIDIPISRKATLGTYDIRIEVERGLWDSVWLDEHLLTLARFEVPKGLLVYFGTIEVELHCEESHRRGQAHYAGHTIQDEFEQEINLFKEEFPQVYELYKNRIVHAEPQAPWKKL